MNNPHQQASEQANEPLRLVFIGPPGSGKGTQAPILKEHYGLAHISTGDLLRLEVSANTDLGREARKYMTEGALVPDQLIIQMIAGVVGGQGFILDGFPRTVNQARKLDEMLGERGLRAVIEFKIEDRLLISRILGRLVHPGSGRSYHVEFHPPRVPMTDDVTGEPLVKRSDDNEEALMNRLAAYHEVTTPVLDYYRQQGILHTVDASDKPEAVWSQIKAALNQ